MKIKVPEGMLKAATEAHCHFKVSGPGSIVGATLEAALRWLSENPIVPVVGDCQRMWNETGLGNEIDDAEFKCVIEYWVRRMFCAAKVKELEGKL